MTDEPRDVVGGLPLPLNSLGWELGARYVVPDPAVDEAVKALEARLGRTVGEHEVRLLVVDGKMVAVLGEVKEGYPLRLDGTRVTQQQIDEAIARRMTELYGPDWALMVPKGDG